MRRKRNGFTRFMNKLDGVEETEPVGVDTSRFHVPRFNWSPRTFIPRVEQTLRDLETTGDPEGLITAFNWESSPQGNRYWNSIYEGNTVIDREGLAYLHWLTKQWDEVR